jgi:hypothetical protein
VSTVTCRRRHERFVLEPGSAWVEFAYPAPGGFGLRMQLRDISASGISFVLTHSLPSLEIGRSIDRASIEVGRRKLHGDLLVMHLTPDASQGSVCGALFYPRGDANILAVQDLVANLEQAQNLL